MARGFMPVRIIKNMFIQVDSSSDSSTKEEQSYEAIRKELVSVRKELYLLERLKNTVYDEALDTVIAQIQAKEEYQHLLIKQAKRIRGEQIRIESSLHEYYRTQQVYN